MAQAKVPALPGAYGVGVIRSMISLSITVTAVMMLVIALISGHLSIHGLLGLGLLAIAVVNILRPLPRLDFGLFKLPSLYLLGTRVLMMAA
jgi:hypothetical protein